MFNYFRIKNHLGLNGLIGVIDDNELDSLSIHRDNHVGTSLPISINVIMDDLTLKRQNLTTNQLTIFTSIENIDTQYIDITKIAKYYIDNNFNRIDSTKEFFSHFSVNKEINHERVVSIRRKQGIPVKIQGEDGVINLNKLYTYEYDRNFKNQQDNIVKEKGSSDLFKMGSHEYEVTRKTNKFIFYRYFRYLNDSNIKTMSIRNYNMVLRNQWALSIEIQKYTNHLNLSLDIKKQKNSVKLIFKRNNAMFGLEIEKLSKIKIDNVTFTVIDFLDDKSIILKDYGKNDILHIDELLKGFLNGNITLYKPFNNEPIIADTLFNHLNMNLVIASNNNDIITDITPISHELSDNIVTKKYVDEQIQKNIKDELIHKNENNLTKSRNIILI